MPYADPARQRQFNREWIARRRAEWFADKACWRCGSTTDLELDHRDPAEKISHKVWSWAKERREAELAKCQVLCHPCHVWKTTGCEERPVRRGEAGPAAKLTEAQVLTIRRAGAEQNYADTGRQLGVYPSTIRKIVIRKTWRYLDDSELSVGADPTMRPL